MWLSIYISTGLTGYNEHAKNNPFPFGWILSNKWMNGYEDPFIISLNKYSFIY